MYLSGKLRRWDSMPSNILVSGGRSRSSLRNFDDVNMYVLSRKISVL